MAASKTRKIAVEIRTGAERAGGRLRVQGIFRVKAD
jgi:hypothetical protein